MNFQIEVLSVVGPVKNQKGKNTWNVFEVAYKKDGKIEGKKIVDFNSPDVFKTVGQAKQGEVYTVNAEKINDFWQWTGFTKQDGGAAQAPTESKESPAPSSEGTKAPEVRASGGGSGRVTGSNYETPEERKVKQRFIIRQSSLTTALTYIDKIKKTPSLDEVMELAEKFVEFVYKQPSAVEGLVQMDDDIPY